MKGAQQVGHFTGKRCFIRNGIQTCNPLHRKIRLHIENGIHTYNHSALLNLCVMGEIINMFQCWIIKLLVQRTLWYCMQP